MSLITPTVALRENRATPLSTGDPMQNFGTSRHCETEGCVARLSRYNPAATCGVHRGWHEPPQPRRRS